MNELAQFLAYVIKVFAFGATIASPDSVYVFVDDMVTVEAGQQIVQTEDASLSQLVDRRVWENMPLEARNTNDFVNLVAGAVPEQQAGGSIWLHRAG